jgi:chromosome segregation and condensation protein ScpB
MTDVATLTIRDVPQRTVRRLKAFAKRQNVSMEQAVRNLLEEHTGDRSVVLEEIERSWERQTSRPKAEEIDSWIEVGRNSGRSE